MSDEINTAGGEQPGTAADNEPAVDEGASMIPSSSTIKEEPTIPQNDPAKTTTTTNTAADAVPTTDPAAKLTAQDPSKDAAAPSAAEAQGSSLETSSSGKPTTSAAAVAERPWDKSNLKVVIHGVMKFHDSKAVSKMLDQWFKDMQNASGSEGAPKLEYDKVKKPPKSTWMMVVMKEEAMVQPLIDYINNNEICNKRGEKLYAKPGIDTESPSRNKKRKSENGDDDDQPASKRLRNAPTTERLQKARRPITLDELKDRITPLWNLTPEQQLHKKMMGQVKKCAQKITKEIKAKFRYAWCVRSFVCPCTQWVSFAAFPCRSH